jgi:hypothetical protein
MFKPTARYYTIGEHTTTDKLTAIKHSEQTGHGIEYHIPDFLLDHDMSVEPEQDLWALCTNHAKFIREKYDYVRLFYSGGCDSHYMLRVFVENNIYIDEIVMHNCGISGCDWEVDDIAVPYIVKVKHLIPETQIKILSQTMLDYYDFYDSPYWFEKYINIGRNSTDITVIRLNNWLESINIYETHGLTANVHGEGKPLICHINNTWYTYFLDCEEFQDGNQTSDYVCFFNDDVEIYSKQCHLLKNAMQKTNTDDYNKLKHKPGWEKFLNESILRVDADSYFIPHIKKPFHPEFRSFNARELTAKIYLSKHHPKVFNMYKQGIDQLKQISNSWWNQNDPELGPILCLSDFICMSEQGVISVDELFPNGFDL